MKSNYLSCHCMEMQKFIRDCARPQNRLVTMKRWKGDYALLSELPNILRNVLSKMIELNTSAINAITKSSMKPWNGASYVPQIVTYAVVDKRNQEQRRTKVSVGRTMMRALELQRLAKRHISGWSNVEQWRNQTHSYRVTLVWRYQSVRQSIR